MRPSLLNRLTDLIDFFIHDNFRQDIDMHFKLRLLVGFILVIIASVLSLLPFFISIEALSTDIMHLYFGFAPPLVLFFSALLWMVRRGHHYRLAAYAVIGTGAAALFGGLVVTGGPANTGLIQLLSVVMVLAFLMLGFKAGLVTAILIAAVNGLLFALHYSGFVFVDVTPDSAREALHIFHWLYTFAILLLLVAIYEVMTGRLKKERDAERKRYLHMATHDGLTGLPNRKCFDQTLASVLALADRNGSQVAVGLLDLDGFKPINDRVGHAAGDVVLQAVAERMKNVLRKSDRVARIGGDEFGLILTNVHALQDVATICDKLLAAIAEPIDFHGQPLRVTGSLGIALYPQHGDDDQQLRVLADHAMYQAKRSRSRWHMHSPDDQHGDMPDSH